MGNFHYIVAYELCALVFLIIITVHFFELRLFPNRQNKLFGVILYCAIADLSLDIIGSYTIEFANLVPPWINYLLNTVFYSLQVIFPALMMSYVVIITGRFFRNSRKLLLLLLPAAFFELVLLTNPFTHFIFYLDTINGALVYTRGPYFTSLYLGSAFYMLVTVRLAVRYRHKLQQKQYAAICCFILVIAVSVLLQFFFPNYLLTGVAITIAILMMFFTMQNPEDMLDLISGMFNYSALLAFLNTRITEKKQFWLIATDVGGIRRINNALSQQTGNQLLAMIGQFFNGLPGQVWAFRMIGTRFLVITDNQACYQQLIGQIEQRFRQSWQVNKLELLLSATICHFGEPDFFQNPEDVINLIDSAFGEIGASGRGSTTLISPQLLQQAKTRLQIEGAIREALVEKSGFTLQYQPLFNLKEQRFTCAEVLLRFRHPLLGNISPGQFIPIAEKAGLIGQIDQMVISKACAFWNKYREDQLPGLHYLEVNLSGAEFFHNIFPQVHQLISDSKLDSRRICFEITETAAATHQKIVEDFMNDMGQAGYHFALDDFGSGYANITQAATLPFSIIKLDRSLLLAKDAKNKMLFANLVQMFCQMGLCTVVEGVETAEQARFVQKLGADYIQGFYYCKPLPEAEFVAFLQQQNAAAPPEKGAQPC